MYIEAQANFDFCNKTTKHMMNSVAYLNIVYIVP